MLRYWRRREYQNFMNNDFIFSDDEEFDEDFESEDGFDDELDSLNVRTTVLSKDGMVAFCV